MGSRREWGWGPRKAPHRKGGPGGANPSQPRASLFTSVLQEAAMKAGLAGDRRPLGVNAPHSKKVFRAAIRGTRALETKGKPDSYLDSDSGVQSKSDSSLDSDSGVQRKSDSYLDSDSGVRAQIGLLNPRR
jgi:hypothetical protein